MVVNIFGKKVPIIIKDISDTGLDGYFDPNTWEIVLDVNSDDLLQTFAHELGHSTFFRTGLIQAKIPHEVQEVIVENIATAISENFAVFLEISKKRNKKQKVRDKIS